MRENFIQPYNRTITITLANIDSNEQTITLFNQNKELNPNVTVNCLETGGYAAFLKKLERESYFICGANMRVINFEQFFKCIKFRKYFYTGQIKEYVSIPFSSCSAKNNTFLRAVFNPFYFAIDGHTTELEFIMLPGERISMTFTIAIKTHESVNAATFKWNDEKETNIFPDGTGNKQLLLKLYNKSNEKRFVDLFAESDDADIIVSDCIDKISRKEYWNYVFHARNKMHISGAKMFCKELFQYVETMEILQNNSDEGYRCQPANFMTVNDVNDKIIEMEPKVFDFEITRREGYFKFNLVPQSESYILFNLLQF